MKKGVLISGIITIVAYSILTLVFSIVGIAQLVGNSMAEGDPGAIPADEVTAVATVFLAIAGTCLLGLIFAAILMGKRNSNMGKGGGIALGIVGIVMGAVVPGIFFVIDSAKTRS